MNITKAIEIKERTGQEFFYTDPDEIDEADRLSFEALKRLKAKRELGIHYDQTLLPGETED